VQIAATTSCFPELSFADACQQIVDLEYSKVEFVCDEQGAQLKPSELAADPDGFVSNFYEISRLTPVAIQLVNDVNEDIFAGLTKLAKLLRVMQITIPAGELGTPFNTEIDRLRKYVTTASREGIRISIKTQAGCLSEDPHTAVELCQAVNGLGITLDPSYYICTRHNISSYDQVFPYVNHVHVRDTTKKDLQVKVGLGEIDYSRLITMLEREGYNRSLSVDLLPDYTDPSTRALEMRKLRMLLETLL